MSLRSQDYADLSSDSYINRTPYIGKDIDVNGIAYKVLEYVDRPSGYQGTIYQRVDTGEIVVAHRGTEFDRQLGKDGVLADGGMFLARANAQAADAIDLTKRAFSHAKSSERMYGGRTPVISVTGHSLGGCLAQITAHHFDLRGETFNPYGAVSLNHRIPEGGNKVINHVMAGDAVSAASPHYGQVRVYATREEIMKLENKGYENNRTVLFDARNAVGAAIALGDSHRMHNFINVNANGRPDRSILEDPQAKMFAQRYDAMIDKYRNDVGAMRGNAAIGVRGVPGLVDDAVDYIRGPLEPGEPARREQRRHVLPVTPEEQLIKHQRDQFWQTPGALMGPRVSMVEPATEARQAEPARLSYLDPAHPIHPLFQELRDKLPTNVSDEKVAELTLAARQGGVRPGQVESVQVHDGKAWVLGTSLFDGMVDLRTPAPPMAETMQMAEVYEQQEVQRIAQWHEQRQSQSHSRTM